MREDQRAGATWHVGRRPDGSLYLSLTSLTRAQALTMLELLFGPEAALAAARTHACLRDTEGGQDG